MKHSIDETLIMTCLQKEADIVGVDTEKKIWDMPLSNSTIGVGRYDIKNKKFSNSLFNAMKLPTLYNHVNHKFLSNF